MYRFYRRLASFCRVIRFDHRGMGMSSRIGADKITPACWAEDAVAVMDAVGCERATIFGSGFTAVSALLPGRRPPRAGQQSGDRQRRGPRPVGARLRRRGASPAAPVRSPRSRWSRTRSSRASTSSTIIAPSVAGDRAFRAWWDTAGNRAASPSMARRANQALIDADVRDKLPQITARDADPASRGLAVRRGRPRPLPRRAHRRFPLRRTARRGHAVLGRRHHTRSSPRSRSSSPGVRGGPDAERVLTTIVFTDIVGSTRARRHSGRRPLARPARQPRRRRPPELAAVPRPRGEHRR